MISEIINGRPYTEGDNRLLTNLSEDDQKIALDWIRKNIHPRKTPLASPTSYGLKHYLERDTKLYLTNNQFKDAMLMCGFFPVDEHALNWAYCISKKSPAFLNPSIYP